jgi:hypothetical protein
MGASARTEGSDTGPLPFHEVAYQRRPPWNGQTANPPVAEEARVSPEWMSPLRTCLPAAWIELLNVFAGLTRFADDPVSAFLDDQILDFRRVMQG